MSKLLLKGGRMIDPGRNLDGPLDVLIEDGRITAAGANLAQPEARVRDCSGAIITPGLIDGHIHCYEGVGLDGIDPDVLGVGSGIRDGQLFEPLPSNRP